MSIDDKVVNMSFEQGKFATGVNDTIRVLDKLKDSLKFPDAGKGLENVDKAASKVNLGHVVSAVDGLTAKFGALNVAALAVFSSIAIHAAQSAAAMAKSFTIGPIIQGFQEYSTNLNAIQTILANTEASGATLKDVNAALLDLNKYSDKTIYNFSQMAKNIGTFTAAGVDLKTATGAIKGIANLAALSGSNAEQASTAMYQLSQAISAGRVSLQDWNSVVNAGMGGTVFQRALATTAVSMGKLKDSSLKLVGPMKNVSIAGQSFRQSIQSGPGKVSWLTSDVLTKTLQQFTGDLTDAQLKAEGFNDAQIKAIQATAKTAQHAATEVKTITQVFAVAKETAGSGWAQTFQIIFGTFGEAKKTFTALSNAINGFINASAKARNNILKDWKALGGRTVLIDSIKTAFHNLGLILKPIKEAFRDIFPRKSGQQLYDLTLRFQALANALKPSDRTLVNLRNTFQGVFAIFDIGKQILVGIISVFGHLFKSAGVGNGGILDLTGSVGDMLFNFDKALKKGHQIQNFFDGLAEILAAPIKLLVKIKDAVSDLFSGFSPGGFSDATKVMAAALTLLHRAIVKTHDAWKKFVDSVQNATSLQAVFVSISNFFQNLGPGIAKSLANVNWELVLSALRTGLFAGLVLLFKNFFGRGAAIDQIFRGLGFGKIIKKNLSGALGTLTGSMKSMQNQIRAKTLKEIAIAIALLAVSVVALSFVNPKRLNSALTAITFMFGQLIVAMALLNKATASAGFVKLPLMIASLVLLAGAIDLLTIAVYVLSRLSWEQLTKGLGAVGFLLAAISASSFALSKNAGGMIRAGIAINIIAVGLNILAIAVAKFGAMDLKTLGKGLGGVAVGLTVLTTALQRMPKRGTLINSVALVVLAEGLKILADAVLKFGNMNLKQLAKGLGSISVALIVIAEALRLMPWNSLGKSVGLFILAYGLKKMAEALAIMGGMSVREIARSLVTLSLALGILSVALNKMTGTLRGSAALALAAASLALLAPSLVLLGKQKWSTLIKGLTALGASLVILGLAAKMLQPAVPALLGFGAAMLLVGAGFALFGAGVLAIGLGLSALAVAGPTAIAIIQTAMIEWSKALPEVVQNLVLALLAIVQAFAKTAPQFVAAIVTIVGQLLTAIIKLTPKFVKAFETLLAAVLKLFYAHKDELVQAGIDIILTLLTGIKNNIAKVVAVAAEVIVNFLKGLASKVEDVLAAGVNVAVRLVKGIVKGLLTLIETMAQAIVDFLNGVAKAIRKYEPQIIRAFFNIGIAIMQGFLDGITSMFPHIRDKIEGFLKSLPKKALGIFKVGSPSKVFYDIGHSVVEGFYNGLKDHQDPVNAVEVMSENVINAVKDKFNMRSPSKVMEQIGKDVNEGFVIGLRGSASDVKQVFTDLNNELLQTANDARDTIKSEQKRLKELQKDPKKNAAAIKDATKIIQENQDILARVTAGHIELTKALTDEKTELLGLSKAYEQVSNKLDAARQALADAKQARKDAFVEYRDQYTTLPEISATDASGNAQDQLAAYEKALEDQITAIRSYHKTLNALRKLGLDDKTYKKLLADGTIDQKFADTLLAGGKTAVTHLNDLDKQLGKSSTDLAHDAASQLYDAGVAAAQGLVDGLRSVKAELASAITSLAKGIVREMKKSLGIKSPSTIFAEIGRQTTEGLAKGLIESSKAVTDAVYMVSDDAMGAISNSLSKISDLVVDVIDPNPTITPVLDLSQIRKDADEVGKMIGIPAITPTISADQAASIAFANSSRSLSSDISPETSNRPMIRLEQNNYSPEALDSMEIYRRTKTQFSQLRAMTR